MPPPPPPGCLARAPPTHAVFARRYTPLWGATRYDISSERPDAVPIDETVSALDELTREGKIRAYGLSNESPYGVGEFVRAAEKLGAAPPATIQNAYSLLCRGFEGELAEACSPRHHNVGLLTWSALCGGLLSGKYSPRSKVAAAPTARFVAYDDCMSRWHPKHASEATMAAASSYADLARSSGLAPAELALLWARTRQFVAHGAVIIGATSVEQLKQNIDAFTMRDDVLTPEIASEIDAIHMRCPNPSNGL